ncbi:hypothetical protein SGPA1_30317 [Streptomyces misionensis JCM 4497]
MARRFAVRAPVRPEGVHPFIRPHCSKRGKRRNHGSVEAVDGHAAPPRSPPFERERT